MLYKTSTSPLRITWAWIRRQPVEETYKEDRRSCVWRIAGPDGPWVVKRYVHPWWRHAFSRLVGRHPVQRELRAMRRLAAEGLPVVPAAASGMTWLATRLVGLSLHNTVRLKRFASTEQREQTLQQAGQLVRQMAEAGWYFRDFKASNLLVDDAGNLWLIDTGSVRRQRQGNGRSVMLERLLETLNAAGLSENDKQQVRRGALGMDQHK